MSTGDHQPECSQNREEDKAGGISESRTTQEKVNGGEVKKELFPGSLEVTTIGDSSVAAGCDKLEDAPLYGDPLVAESDALGSPAFIPDAPREELSDEGVSSQQSPKDLKFFIDPSRSPPPPAAKDGSGAAAAEMAAVGMSPGARSFAPPFGARFGDRSCAPHKQQHAKGKGMERVKEEEEGGEAFGEMSPDSGAPRHFPAPPNSPMVVGVASVLAHTSLEDAVHGTVLSPVEGHAHRVASTAHGSFGAAAETASRPRLRMAFEGKRDEVAAPVESSKFAPTPRVKPKDGLPWGK